MTCSICGEVIAADWLRWWCTSCGLVIHYACVAGGVPVRERPPCPECDSPNPLAAAWNEAEQDQQGQARLF